MKYTVVLRRPYELVERWELDDFRGEDVYVATVEAADMYLAVEAAKLQVFAADKKDDKKTIQQLSLTAREYHHILTLEGHCKVARFGWQL